MAVALITGASSGIGKEFAILHASLGDDLVIIATNGDKLYALKQDLEDKYNVKVKVIVKDLSIITASQEIYDEVKRENIIVDYLINNAGFGGQGYFYERDMLEDVKMIEVNIVALTMLCRLFLADFVKRDSGKILNVASVASIMPGGPMQSVYFASKAYVLSFTRGLYAELEGSNVSATAILPEAINTNFAKRSGLDKTKMFDKATSPIEVAKQGYEAMQNGELERIIGYSGVKKIIVKTMPIIAKRRMLKKLKQIQSINF